MMKPRYLAPLVFAAALAVAVIPYDNATLRFERWLTRDSGEAVVVMPVDQSFGPRSLVRGAQLAARVINDYPDRLLGKRLVLEPVNEPSFDDGSKLVEAVDTARTLARRIVDRWAPLAVFGHDTSVSALTVASTYERENVLFLSPFATDPTLTRIRLDNVFSMVPDDRQAVTALTRLLIGRDWRRVMVINDLTAYGTLSGRLFIDEFRSRCGEVVHKEVIPQGGLGSDGKSIATRVDKLVMSLMNNPAFDIRKVDAVVVFGLSDLTAALIKRARYLGVETPVLGSDNVTWITPDEKDGAAGLRGVYGTSTYNPDSADNLRAVFRRVYRETYGENPDNEAAIGWDGMMLLHRAAKAAGTLDAEALAKELRAIRYVGSFSGMAGTYDFSFEGEAVNKPLYVVEWTESGLRTVLTHQPNNPMPMFCLALPR
jgi:branched-chain amino acid transport system substrate-binding protein